MNRIPFGANGLRLMCAGASAALASIGALCQGKPPPASMVVVYARDDAGSLSLARHYAAARGIPDANLIPVSSPAAEVVSRAEFTSRIWNPLVRELYKRGLVKGLCLSEASLDREGRQLAQPRSHSISWLASERHNPLTNPRLYNSRTSGFQMREVNSARETTSAAGEETGMRFASGMPRAAA
jgi:uncharacterized protein (TIGR03790 family)